MVDIWFISDTHWAHSNILKFKDENENPIRPFSSVEEMDEKMIQNWNSVVKYNDKVYHLGDVCFKSAETMRSIMQRLNGNKRLVLGNHDHYNMQEYARWFQKIGSWRQFKDMSKPFIACHYPLHDSALYKRGPEGKQTYCVHGHIHQRIVMNGNQPDNRYINVCVEKINYTPIHIDDLMKKMK